MDKRYLLVVADEVTDEELSDMQFKLSLANGTSASCDFAQKTIEVICDCLQVPDTIDTSQMEITSWTI